MPKWIQLDLFTGEPIPSCDADTEDQQRLAKNTQLALEIQLSVARMDALTDTFKYISELCENLIGIHFPFDIAKQQDQKQRHRQEQTLKNVDTEIQESKRRGRPKGSTSHNTPTAAQKQAIYGKYRKPRANTTQQGQGPHEPSPETMVVLETLKSHREGLTRHTLCKSTGLDPQTAQTTIDQLLALGKIEHVERKGWKRYTVV